MKKIIYPYIRFSSEQQAEGHSYKRQMNDILNYAKNNGFTVNNSLKLMDLGFSAYTAEHIEKGSLGDFLEAIESGKIERDGSAYLCVEQIDRLSRQSIDDAYQVFRKILKSNVNIITIMDNNIYTKESLNNFMSIMYSSMLMEQANIESEKKSKRILKKFNEKLENLNKGEPIQYVGMLPGWIDNKGTKKKTNFVLNKKHKIVKDVFKMYIEGTSMGDIARILNEKGIEQVAKKRQKNFTNSWSSAKINHLLKNRCVLGELNIKKTGQVFKNYYPPIISIDDWDIVQSMTSTKKTNKYSGRKSINIFSGKVFCSGCGQKYYFETDDKITKKGRTLYYMLKCQGRRVLDCKSKSIKYDDFLSSTPNLFGMLSKNKQDNSEEIEKIKNQIKSSYSKIKELEDKKFTLEKLNDNDELDFTVYVKESSKLQKSILVNEARIADFKAEISRLSSDNKLDFFEKTDPVSIKKAKRFINENFAALVISSDSRSCTALYSNGKVINFFIQNSKVEKRKDVVSSADGLSEFYKLKEDVFNAYKSGRMDGKFIEILRSTNYWGVETPEKDYHSI
ncbi:TPA: recombinase family protein [Vibrio parahaemolyticus]|nr:recombinase family protein [Vibrio parahaemolyticus]